jgi:propionyl-CoA carboxylase beta chain
MEELGGGRVHAGHTGCAHHAAASERDAMEYARALLSYLPSNNSEDPPSDEPAIDLTVTAYDRELDGIVPDAANQPYDMYEVVEHLLDDGRFLEVHDDFALNAICGFGRMDGHTVGVVANQPDHLGGALDIDAAEKIARFVRTCDAYNVPVLTLVDVPGFLPGTTQELQGVIRRGAKLLYAYAEATVPMVTVTTRKAYGGGYGVMGPKQIGVDLSLAWPTARIAVMGPQVGVDVLHRRELRERADAAERRADLVLEYERTLDNAYVAAARGYVDGVIAPCETRGAVIRAFRMLAEKRELRPPRKHGNIPL